MAAVDFLASRGMGEAQGKKVVPSAVASQTIEAQPSFGQIKPWRGRVVRTPNSILRRRRGGRRMCCTRGAAFQAKKRKPWRSERTISRPGNPCRRRHRRWHVPLSAWRHTPTPAPKRRSWRSRSRGRALVQGTESTSSAMMTAQPHPSRVASAIGNDAGPPAPRRSTCGGTNSDMRAQAVPPIRTAPTIAKASRQPSDGTPMWSSPNVAW
jgi:hypothetical protein